MKKNQLNKKEIKKYIQKAKANYPYNLEVLKPVIKFYYPIIFQYIYKNVLIKEDALDICQNTFLNFLQYIEKYNEDMPLENYLYSIAKNEISKFYAKKNKNLPTLPFYEEIVPSNESDNKDKYLIQEENIRFFYEKIYPYLNEKEKQIFILYYKKGYKIKEIMNILNKKESAIKMRLVRLREKIQRIMYGKK